MAAPISRLSAFWLRVPLFLLAVAALVVAVVVAQPPRHMTIQTGPVGGSYHQAAEAYQAYLAKKGITLDIQPVPNSMEIVGNVARPGSGADVGFIAQDVSGLARAPVFSLGQIQLQPLFVFATADLGRRSMIHDLRGRRIVMPPENSATSDAAVRVLALYDITPDNSSFSFTLLADAAKALQDGKYDAGIFMLTPENDTIRRLAGDSSLRLVPFSEANAVANHLPFLRRVVMPRGIYSIADAIPPNDTPLVAATVGVIAREGLHPYLAYSLLEAMRQEHRGATFLSAAGEFPTAAGSQFAIQPQAERFYRDGVPWNYRDLPAWLASVVDRYTLVGLAVLLFAALYVTIRSLADMLATLIESLALARIARIAAAAEASGRLSDADARRLAGAERMLRFVASDHDTAVDTIARLRGLG